MPIEIEEQFLRLDPLQELPRAKASEKLSVRFNARETARKSEASSFEISVYDVLNQTHQTAYEVELMSVNSGRKLGRCSCQKGWRRSHKCKHLLPAVILHVARKAGQLRAEEEALERGEREAISIEGSRA